MIFGKAVLGKNIKVSSEARRFLLVYEDYVEEDNIVQRKLMGFSTCRIFVLRNSVGGLSFNSRNC